MFDTEAHRPYLALMRELRLEREVEQGDWIEVASLDGLRSIQVRRAPGRQVGRTGAVWLPRLDQWLVMLEEALASPYRRTAGGDPPAFLAGSNWARRQALGMLQVRAEHCPDESIEEAAARLWLAVTGRAVTA